MPSPDTPQVEPLPSALVAPVAPNSGKDGVDTTAGQKTDLSGKPADALIANSPAPDAGRVHEEFVGKTKEVIEATAKADMDVLTGKSPEAYTIEDIRYNSRLLNKKQGEEKPEDEIANLKDETARRMKAYSASTGDGWFKLNYANLGSDKLGMSHELYVGLGDILLDIDIQNILVEIDGRIVKAHRGIASDGSHSGRVCFLDENNEYVATHTGDRFRIVSNENIPVSDYSSKYKEENEKRVAGRASFKASTTDLYVAEKDFTLKEGIDLKETYKDADDKEVTVGITNEIIEGAAAECAKSSSIEKAAERRKNLMKVLNYIAHKVGVPASAMLAVIYHECGIRFPANIGDGGKAVGMGQIHPAGWATVKKNPKFSELVGPVILEAGRNKNIFVDLVGVAIFMKNGIETFGFNIDDKSSVQYLTEEMVTAPDGIAMSRMSWIRMFYHVPSYARDYAMAIKAGSIDALKPSYKERLLAKSQPWLKKNMSRYIKLSDNTALAYRSMDANEGTMSA